MSALHARRFAGVTPHAAPRRPTSSHADDVGELVGRLIDGAIAWAMVSVMALCCYAIVREFAGWVAS